VRERQVIEYCRGRDFSVEKLRELVADFE
jgi:hypothetical protein